MSFASARRTAGEQPQHVQHLHNAVDAHDSGIAEHRVVDLVGTGQRKARSLPDLVARGGIGERPAIAHWRRFGLRAFTSGSVCVAPRGSMRLLHLLKEQRFGEAEALRAKYLPLEDCRDAMGPIRVLHDAVTLAGIADMGSILPLLSNLDAAERARVLPAARALLAHDQTLLEEKAT